MIGRSLAIAVCLLGWSIAGTATARADYQTRSVAFAGAWSGGAYNDPTTHRFDYCVASVSYRSGITLAVAIDRTYNWRIGFANQSWNLNVGSRIPLVMSFDSGAPWTLTGQVVNHGMVRVGMPANSSLINAFRGAYTMRVYALGETFGFNLTNTSEMVPELADCVRSELALEANGGNQNTGAGLGASLPETTGQPGQAGGPPEAAGGNTGPENPTLPPAQVGRPPEAAGGNAASETLKLQPGQGAGPAADVAKPNAASEAALLQPGQGTGTGANALSESANLQLAATRIASNLLVAARLPNARLLPDAQTPVSLKGHGVAWTSDAGAGTVALLPANTAHDPQELASLLISGDATACKGEFESSRSTDVVDDHMLATAFADCKDAGAATTFRYFVLRAANAAYVVFELAGGASSGAPAAGLSDAAFRAAAVAAAYPH